MLDDDKLLSKDVLFQEPVSPFDAQVMLNRVLLLDWNDLAAAQKIESDLYSCLQRSPDKTEYLILMMLIQLVLQKVERAYAFAYKIWEKGGTLSLPFQMIFAHTLSVLNLKEMATQIFTPVLNDIQNLPQKFFQPVLNFAFAYGNKDLLRLVAAHASQDVFEALQNFIGFCDAQNYWRAFSYSQQIIFEKCSHNLLDFNVSLNMGKGFCLVNFNLFVAQNAPILQTEINSAIDDFCFKHKLVNNDNLYVNVLPANLHLPLVYNLLPVL